VIIDACAYVGNKISQAISSRKMRKEDEELKPKPEAGRSCVLEGSKPKQNGAAYTQYSQPTTAQSDGDPPPY